MGTLLHYHCPLCWDRHCDCDLTEYYEKQRKEDELKRIEEQRLIAEQHQAHMGNISSISRPIGTFYAENCRGCSKQATCNAYPFIRSMLQTGEPMQMLPCRSQED